MILSLQAENKELKQIIANSGLIHSTNSGINNSSNLSDTIKGKSMNQSFDKLVHELAQIKYEKEELERAHNISELNLQALSIENEKLRLEKIQKSQKIQKRPESTQSIPNDRKTINSKLQQELLQLDQEISALE